MKDNYKVLGDYIEPVDERNKDLSINNLLGVSISKRFITSIANIIGTDLSNYKIVRTGQFAYGPVTSRNGEKVSIAFLNEDDCIISSSYSVFKVTDIKQLDPQYLMLWFSRPEFDRYARYKSHGSVREIFDWDELCQVELPVPHIDKQKDIVKAYNIISDRIELKRKINDNLEAQAYFLYREMFCNNVNNAWHIGTLNELLSVKYGKDHKHLANGKIPLYGSGGIMRFVSKALYNKTSVLIPRKGTLSNVMYVDEPFWSVDTMFYTEISKPFAAKFIYYFVKSKDLAGMDTGSAVPSMSSEIIHSMELAIPDDNTLICFDNRVQPLYNAIKLNTQEIHKLEAMQEVLLSTLSSC